MPHSVVAALLLLALWAPSARADDVIVYTRPDGGVSVVNPAPACLADLQRPVGSPPGPGGCPALGLSRAGALDWVRQKDVPPDAVGVEIRDRATLPASRRFRNAWRRHGSAVMEDLAESRNLKRQALEREIDRRIRASDAAGQTATEEGHPAKAAAHQAHRNALRALRGGLAADLAGIADIDQLDAWTPSYPVSP